MRGRPKKLNTEAEIDRACFLYYETKCGVRKVAEHMGVAIPTIERVLKEHSSEYKRKRGMERVSS